MVLEPHVQLPGGQRSERRERERRGWDGRGKRKERQEEGVVK
jgi:hypothetical protein